jgi:hypothetical protein
MHASPICRNGSLTLASTWQSDEAVGFSAANVDHRCNASCSKTQQTLRGTQHSEAAEPVVLMSSPLGRGFHVCSPPAPLTFVRPLRERHIKDWKKAPVARRSQLLHAIDGAGMNQSKAMVFLPK